MNLTYGVDLAGLAVAVGLFFCFIPVLTRSELFFAVTVPSAFHATAEGRGILAAFRLEVLVHTVIAAAGALAIARWGSTVAAPLMLLWLLLGSLHAFLRALHLTQAHAVTPSSLQEASLEPRDPLPGGWFLQIGPFLLIAIAALTLTREWARLPERLPVRWSWQGRPSGWAARTPGFLAFQLVLSAALCALFAYIAWLVARRSRVIHLHGPAGGSERQFRRIVMTLLLMIEYVLAVSFSGVLLLPLLGASGHVLVLAMPTFALAITVGAILMLIRIGQGGSRVAYAGTPGGAPVGDRTLDEHWKLGIFYFNPGDPALLVEKRFGLGYTFNFGHPAGWIIFGAGVVAFLIGVGHRFHRLL